MEAGVGSPKRQASRRRHLDERAWREVFKRFDAAGLTVEAFCQGEGICRSSFNRWRSRLSMQPGSAAAAMAAPVERNIAPSFVDLGLLGSSGAPTPAGLELRLELGAGLSLTLVRR